MVVVLGQVFGQLETCELVAGRQTPDHAGTLQIDQVPVGRAPGDAGQLPRDVRDAHRVAQRRQ